MRADKCTFRDFLSQTQNANKKKQIPISMKAIIMPALRTFSEWFNSEQFFNSTLLVFIGLMAVLSVSMFAASIITHNVVGFLLPCVILYAAFKMHGIIRRESKTKINA